MQRVLAIFTHFHSRHCEINFKKEDAARESTPRTAIEDSRARAYGSEKPGARAIQQAIYGHHPGPFTWRTRRAVPNSDQITIERFLDKEKFYGAFNPISAIWNTIKTFWQKPATLTFDEILARGIQQQQVLHAVEVEDNAHGVRKLAATVATAESTATELAGFDARETGSLASLTDHDTENKRNITTDFETVRKHTIGF